MDRKRSRKLGCRSPIRVTASLLLSFLAITPAASQAGLEAPLQPRPNPNPIDLPRAERRLDFRLQHIFHHGTNRHPGMLRKIDVLQETPVWMDEGHHRARIKSLSVSSTSLNIQRLVDRRPESMEALMEAGREQGEPIDLPVTAWTVDTIPGPNVTDKETVLSFARMASNAYILEPNTGEWEDVGGGFNYTEDFGWESDGLRGHIFADTENKTVVIGLKGTSPAVFDGADTTTNDKINDNLFFSCCCGQGGSVLWHQVCDCKTATFTCNSTCVVKTLGDKDHYYMAAQMLYHNVTAIYPHSDVWLAGHSLGGAVSALLGLTYGLPTITFEAPGDAMPAARLGLPTPPGYHVGSALEFSSGIYHFGHTGDPIYMGTCSACTLAGYAMESVCHTGMECRYDTVKDKGFHNYIGNHKIYNVIHDVLEVYDEPAKCVVVTDCVDCYNWKYFKSNSSSSTTKLSSTTTAYTRTRTETCKSPGWWGCLDESTGTHSKTSTSTTTTSSTTSTCKTPGWFGCLDETTTTTTTTSTTTSSSTSLKATTTTAATTSCETPGWFGCKDPTQTADVALQRNTPVSLAIPTQTIGGDHCARYRYDGL